MARRQYVYYRVREAELDDVVDTVLALHDALRRHDPALQVELLRRPELKAGELTLMEVYGGASDEALSQIETAMAAALAPWLASARHVEVFDKLG